MWSPWTFLNLISVITLTNLLNYIFKDCLRPYRVFFSLHTLFYSVSLSKPGGISYRFLLNLHAISYYLHQLLVVASQSEQLITTRFACKFLLIISLFCLCTSLYHQYHFISLDCLLCLVFNYKDSFASTDFLSLGRSTISHI